LNDLGYGRGDVIGFYMPMVPETLLHTALDPCVFAGPIPDMGAVVIDEAGHSVRTGHVDEQALTAPPLN
jgi:hypothetical protein